MKVSLVLALACLGFALPCLSVPLAGQRNLAPHSFNSENVISKAFDLDTPAHEVIGEVFRQFSDGSNSFSRRLNILDFGAVGDGETDNTESFKEAVQAIAKMQGGILDIPKGTFLTAPFNLTSRMALHVKEGAVISAVTDFSRWPVVAPLPSYGKGRDLEGGGSDRYTPFVACWNCTDIFVVGKGVIEGNGAPWWAAHRAGQLKHTRGRLLEILFSKNVVIAGVTFRNSPFWTVHPYASTDVAVVGVTTWAPGDSPNTDGVDPDSCLRTVVRDCLLQGGDDGIAVKSGWDEYGIRFGMPNKDLRVHNIITSSGGGSNGVTVGSETSGGIINMHVSNVRVFNHSCGVRIKSGVGRGGVIENIIYEDIDIHSTSTPIQMDETYGGHPDEHWDPHALPVIRNVTFARIRASGANHAGKFNGLDNDVMKGVELDNVHIQANEGWQCVDVEGNSVDVTPAVCGQLQGQTHG